MNGVRRRRVKDVLRTLGFWRGLEAAPLAFLLCAAAPTAPAVSGAFARATAVGQSTGGVFLTITSPAGDTLTGASSDDASHVSLHRMTMSGSVMQMRELKSVDLPAGKPVTFAPGIMHLMLEGLVHPLRRGETISLRLHLAHAGEVPVDVPVAGPGASMPPMPGMSP